MSLADEYKMLERRFLSARQQIEHLQSNVRILKSSNDDLADRAEALQKEAKQYKKAFDEIFIHNVGASWDNIPPQEREKMGINEKIEFYKRETSNTQAYMKKSFYEFQGGAQKEVEALKKKVDELQRNLHQAEASLAESKEAMKPKATDRVVNKDYLPAGQARPVAKQDGDASQAHAGIRKPVGTPFTFSRDKAKKNQHRNQFLVEKKETTQETKGSDKEKILESIEPLVAQESSAKEKPTTTNPPADSTKPKEATEQKNKNIETREKKVSIKGGFHAMERIAKMTGDEQKKLVIKAASFMEGDSAINQNEMLAVYILGSTGLFAAKDILSEMKEGRGDMGFSPFGRSSVSVVCQSLENRGLVSKTLINTAGKGRPSAAYVLTDMGKWLYFFRFKQDPVESLIAEVSKNQKSVAHGTDILNLVNILKDRGYACTQEVIGKTDEGDSISDILAKKGNYSYYIEYEEGNYPEKGYVQKFTRINKLRRNVIFVTKDIAAAKKLESYYKDFLADEANAEYRNNLAAFLPFSSFQGGGDPLESLR